MSGCLSGELVIRYAAGLLSDEDRQAVDRHADDCEACRQRLGGALHPLRHGRYDIEHELGRGGLGRVVAARDRRLRRVVALKEPLDRDGHGRARFEREARVTARLQHPAIVPLYDVDAWPGGEPFYSMKLVSGRTLGRLVADAATLDERIALVPNVLAVCEAMAYAHGEGVIHRDLKPANVLVGAFGETVVIDWGLAKDLRAADAEPETAAPAAAEGDATLAGVVLGTPAYMPPEQARGEAVDERADVYALGALLYHVLAGAPPYPAGRIDAVVAAAPLPLAQRQPGIARDLTTIVARAMARDPAARYPTAKELAEDLRRFTTGQLVRSHVYSRTAIVRRFVRRNRGAVLVAAVMLALIAGGGALALRQIVHERNLAERQRGAAEMLVQYSLSKLSDQLDRIGHLDLLRDVGAEVETYYRTVLATDPALADAAAVQRSVALLILGNVRWDAGDLEGALALYRSCQQLLERQARLRPDSTAWIEGLLSCRTKIGRALTRQGRDDLALESLNAALPLVDRLAVVRPGDRAWLSWQGRLWRAIGDVHSDKLETRAALASYFVSLTATLLAAPRAGANETWQRDLESTYSDLATQHLPMGQMRAAVGAARAGLAIAEDLARGDPSSASYQEDLSDRSRDLCRALRQTGEVRAATVACRVSLDTAERLVAHDPANMEWLLSLALATSGLADVQGTGGEIEAALAGARHSIVIRARLAGAEPSAPENVVRLAVTFRFVASLELAIGDLAVARVSGGISVLLLEAAIFSRRDWTSGLGWLASAHEVVGDIELQAGDADRARLAYLTGIAMIATEQPRDEFDERTLARCFGGLSRALSGLGAQDDALAVARIGLTLDEELARANPESQAPIGVGNRWLEIGDVLAAQRRWTAAVAAYQAALALHASLAWKTPENVVDQKDLGIAHDRLGAALRARGDVRAAGLEARAALAILEPLAARAPGDARVGAALAAARIDARGLRDEAGRP